MIVALALSFHGGGIFVTISSTHPAYSVVVAPRVDGSVKTSLSVPPGYQMTWQGQVTWFGGGAGSAHEVEGVSSGGAFGPFLLPRPYSRPRRRYWSRTQS